MPLLRSINNNLPSLCTTRLGVEMLLYFCCDLPLTGPTERQKASINWHWIHHKYESSDESIFVGNGTPPHFFLVNLMRQKIVYEVHCAVQDYFFLQDCLFQGPSGRSGLSSLSPRPPALTPCRRDARGVWRGVTDVTADPRVGPVGVASTRLLPDCCLWWWVVLRAPPATATTGLPTANPSVQPATHSSTQTTLTSRLMHRSAH